MKEKLTIFFEKNIIYIFISLIVWIIIGPILLTQFSFLDFTNTGGIGETISGISAPAIGLFSIILLYLALLKQIENNRSTQNEANFKIIYQEICNFKNDINTFQYDNYNGKDAIKRWAEDLKIEIFNNKFTIALKGLGYIEKAKLPILDIGRIFFLKENLKTNDEYNIFIKKELTYMFSYYLKDVYDVIITWDLEKTDSIFKDNFIVIQLKIVQETWKNVETKILKL